MVLYGGIDGKKPLLARWTSDWDCGHETNWWFCIRDGIYDVEQLSPSSRKHIRQAMKKNNVVRTRISEDLLGDMYKVYKEATSHYSNADNILGVDDFKNGMRSHPNNVDLFLAYKN